MRSMSRAIGALMRTNVAVYAIDPRGANLADADLLETPLISQAGMRNALAGRTLADEQNDSIRTLHSLSDSTGGFAAVNRNDFAGAFDAHPRREQLVLRRRLYAAACRQAWRVSTDRGEGVAAGRQDQRPERLYRQGRAGAPRQPAGHERAVVRFPDAVHARARACARAGERAVRAAGDRGTRLAAAGAAREPASAARTADPRAGRDARR